MESIIKSLENQVVKLKKIQSKYDFEYRKDSSGFNYGRACETGKAIRLIEEQIENLKAINNSKPF